MQPDWRHTCTYPFTVNKDKVQRFQSWPGDNKTNLPSMQEQLRQAQNQCDLSNAPSSNSLEGVDDQQVRHLPQKEIRFSPSCSQKPGPCQSSKLQGRGCLLGIGQNLELESRLNLPVMLDYSGHLNIPLHTMRCGNRSSRNGSAAVRRGSSTADAQKRHLSLKHELGADVPGHEELQSIETSEIRQAACKIHVLHLELTRLS